MPPGGDMGGMPGDMGGMMPPGGDMGGMPGGWWGRHDASW